MEEPIVEGKFVETPYCPYQHTTNNTIAERLANLSLVGLPGDIDPVVGIAGPIFRSESSTWSKRTTISLIHDILKHPRYREIVKGLHLLIEAGVPLKSLTTQIENVRKGVVPWPIMGKPSSPKRSVKSTSPIINAKSI